MFLRRGTFGWRYNAKSLPFILYSLIFLYFVCHTTFSKSRQVKHCLARTGSFVLLHFRARRFANPVARPPGGIHTHFSIYTFPPRSRSFTKALNTIFRFQAAGSYMQRAVTIWSEGSSLVADVFVPDDARDDQRYPAILLCHGWGGLKSHLAQYASRFSEGRFCIFTHKLDLAVRLQRVQAMGSGDNPSKIMPEDVWST